MILILSQATDQIVHKKMFVADEGTHADQEDPRQSNRSRPQVHKETVKNDVPIQSETSQPDLRDVQTEAANKTSENRRQRKSESKKKMLLAPSFFAPKK